MTNQERDPARRAGQPATPEQDGGVATEAAPQDAPPSDAAPKKPGPADPASRSALEDISSETGGAADPAPADPSPVPGRKGIHMLMDVDLTVTAELGRTRMTIGQIVNLSAGSIIPLSKVAGETVDLRINGKLLASGEVIVVDGNFAVKITKLLSKEERVKNFS